MLSIIGEGSSNNKTTKVELCWFMYNVDYHVLTRHWQDLLTFLTYHPRAPVLPLKGRWNLDPLPPLNGLCWPYQYENLKYPLDLLTCTECTGLYWPERGGDSVEEFWREKGTRHTPPVSTSLHLQKSEMTFGTQTQYSVKSLSDLEKLLLLLPCISGSIYTMTLI